MGDRCYISLRCRRRDVKAFEEAGYVEDDSANHVTGDEGVHGVLMVNEEGYADLDALPKVPYYGSHGSGCSYGPGEFACDGKETAETETIEGHGQSVATIFADGSISLSDYEAGVKFWAFLNRVRRRFRDEPRGVPADDVKTIHVRQPIPDRADTPVRKRGRKNHRRR